MKNHRGTYIGPESLLKGKTALVQLQPGGDTLLAQFDSTVLTMDGKHLGFGWHLFKRSEWRVWKD